MKTLTAYFLTALLAAAAPGDMIVQKENAGSPKYTATALTFSNLPGAPIMATYAALSGATFSGNISATNLSGINTGDQTTITGNAGTVTSIGNLTGVVTSSNRATSIADGALTIAKTSGLQTALDGKQASGTYATGGGTATGTNTGDQDISGKANLTGGNSFSGSQIIAGGGSLATNSGATFRTFSGSTITLENASDWRTSLGLSSLATTTPGTTGLAIVQAATVATARTALAIQTLVKSGNTSRSSSNTGVTRTADPHLAGATIVAGKIYRVDFCFFLDTGAGAFAADLVISGGISHYDSGSKQGYGINVRGDANLISGMSATSSTKISLGYSGTATGGCLSGYATFAANSAGTATVEWSQNLSNAANTTMKTNSYVVITQIN